MHTNKYSEKLKMFWIFLWNICPNPKKKYFAKLIYKTIFSISQINKRSENVPLNAYKWFKD